MDNILVFCESTAQKVWKYVPHVSWAEPAKIKVETSTQTPVPSSAYSFKLPSGGDGFIRQGHPLIRVAGISGAAAIALGAYGAHSFTPEKQDLKRVYDTANFYHFMHTIALIAVPLTKRPYVTGGLMLGGMTIFCGTIYYHALTEDKKYRKITPYGGMMLIAAWLSMVV